MRPIICLFAARSNGGLGYFDLARRRFIDRGNAKTDAGARMIETSPRWSRSWRRIAVSGPTGDDIRWVIARSVTPTTR
jgi:hypothetical protein